MDSSKKRTVISIAIMTCVCLIVAIVSVYFMFANNDSTKERNKDYISVIEKELNVDITSDDDFIGINQNGFEIHVMENKFSTYITPCFEYIIDSDKIIITRALSKEFYAYPLMVGSEIVKIDGTELKGLGYFEIEELINGKALGLKKEFTLSDGKVFEYTYEKYTYYSSLINEKKIVLSLYNLDRINRKQVYDIVKDYEDVTIDLSKATVTDINSLADFISLFVTDKAPIFSFPEGIYGYKTYKLNDINLVLGNNIDKGILFTLTSIKNHNFTITFDVSKDTLNVMEFDCKKVIKSSNYTVTIYNQKVKAIENTSGGITGLCK